MKIYSVNNIYKTQNFSNEYNNINYPYINNIQPKQLFQRQESSVLLPIKNNLLISTPQQVQQIPNTEISMQQPSFSSGNNSQKIIRIKKRIFKRSLSPYHNYISYKNSNNFNNYTKNETFNNENTNNQINILNDAKNDFSLINVQPIEKLPSMIPEPISPAKKNKIVSYNALSPINNYNYYSPKAEYKHNKQIKKIAYNYSYSDYKRYNNDYFTNISTIGNFNYNGNVISNGNGKNNYNILNTKVSNSLNNLTSNYLKNSNNYLMNNIDESYSITNCTTTNSQNYYNNINNNNDYYYSNNENDKKNNIYYGEQESNYIQTNITAPTNYNTNNSSILTNKLSVSNSSNNILYPNPYPNYNSNYFYIPIKMHGPLLNRSMSSDNIKYNNKNINNNHLNKSGLISHDKIQNITIIKDPMLNKINNNINEQETDTTSFNKNNNSAINNDYNIDFNININNDYNIANNATNELKNNNIIPIKTEELEPNTNFNLLEFVKTGVVGRGTEGIIYSVKWKKNNKSYALKKGIIKLKEVVLKRQEEINMLKEFRKSTGSEGVISIYGYLCTTNKNNYYDFYEIMELAEMDWEQEIEQRGKLRIYYSESELMYIMYQIVHTFCLLQKNRITHRDIKPQNIIKVKGKYKIIDFGNARILKRDGLVVQRIRGSEMYMSPVMFKGYHSKLQRVKHNTFKSDVFSLGMCFLLAASLSYNPLNAIRELYDNITIERIVRYYIGQRYSENVYCILLAMLQVEEYSRPDFIQLDNLFKKLNGYA